MKSGLLLIALALLVSSEKAPTPSFRFSYQQNNVPVSQYFRGADGTLVYNWGYNFPGRSHQETKDTAGTVSGKFEFVDANGELQRTSYNADPVAGFIVDGAAHAPVVPLKKVAPKNVRYDISPVFVEEKSDVKPTVPEVMLKNAPEVWLGAKFGYLEPVESNDNELVFRVGSSLVQESQGSVSALAHKLGADLVAAQHDTQIYRPSFYYDDQYPIPVQHSALDSEQNFKPVLETVETGNSVDYFVRVPISPSVDSAIVTEH